jgi:hypothetical protein
MTELEREMQEIDEIVLSAEDEADIDYALAHARDPEDEEVAVAASFDVTNRLLLIELKTGQRLALPQEDLQDIADANPSDLAEIEILGPGTTLHFEKAMQGIHVDAVRRGIYGSERWMDGLAQRRRERLQRAS